jgi:hypothetical protein
MMDNISPRFYREQASELFQLVRTAFDRNSARDGSYDGDALNIMTICLADNATSGHAARYSTRIFTQEEMLEMCHETEIRIKTRCAGLLETKRKARDSDSYTKREPGSSVVASRFARKLPHPSRYPHNSSTSSLSMISPAKAHRILSIELTSEWKVQYLHRTVRDFLEQPEIWASARKMTDNTPFDANSSMLTSSVIQLKMLFPLEASHLTYPNSSFAAPFWRHVLDALVYASQGDAANGRCHTELLDELNGIVQTHWHYSTRDKSQYSASSWTSHIPKKLPWIGAYCHRAADPHGSFLCLAIQYRLIHYVRHKLNADGTLVQRKVGRPLLDYAVRRTREKQEPLISDALVGLLLQHGADPNEVFQGCSVWQNALGEAHQYLSLNTFTHRDQECLGSWISALELLVLYGADPEATINFQRPFEPIDGTAAGKISARPVIDTFRSWLPLELSEGRTRET